MPLPIWPLLSYWICIFLDFIWIIMMIMKSLFVKFSFIFSTSFYFLESSTKISTSCDFLHFNSFLTFMMSIWYLWMLTILCAWHPEIGSEIDFHSQISLKQFEWILFAYKLSTSHTLSKLSFPQRDIKIIFIYKHRTFDYMLILPSGDVFKTSSWFKSRSFYLSRTAFQI